MGCGASGQQGRRASPPPQSKLLAVLPAPAEPSSDPASPQPAAPGQPNGDGSEQGHPGSTPEDLAVTPLHSSGRRKGSSRKEGSAGGAHSESPLRLAPPPPWIPPPPLDPAVRLGRCIGKGRFGRVTEADWYLTTVAAKEARVISRRGKQTARVLCNSLCNPSSPQIHDSDEEEEAATRRQASCSSALQREIGALSSLMHPNIVQFLGDSRPKQGGETVMLTELSRWGCLEKFMKETFPYSWDRYDECHFGHPTDIALEVADQIGSALHYMHCEGCVHRDVRAANILVHHRPPGGHYKLADLGLARELDEFGQRPGSSRSVNSMSNSQLLPPLQLSTQPGSTRTSVASFQGYSEPASDTSGGAEVAEFPWAWTSPEANKTRIWTAKTDCWMLGVVMWEVGGQCETKPYGPGCQDQLISGELLTRPDGLREDVWERVVMPCFQPEATRVRAVDIVSIARGLLGTTLSPDASPGPVATPRPLLPAELVHESPFERRIGTHSSTGSGRMIRKPGLPGGKTVEREDVKLSMEPVSSRVFRGSWRSCAVAVKECQRAEVLCLRKLRHPHVVQYLGDAGNLVLTAWCSEGSLTDYVLGRKGRGRDEDDPSDLVWSLRVVSQVAAALHYLHSLKIVHNAVRAGNVFVERSGACRLGALSRCRFPPNSDSIMVVNASALPSDSPSQEPYPLPDSEDAWRWRAPETMGKAADWGVKGDVWSLGVLAWEVITEFAEVPYSVAHFGRERHAKSALRSGTPLPMPLNVDPWTWHEAVAPLFEEPLKRPTAGQVVLMTRHVAGNLEDGILGKSRWPCSTCGQRMSRAEFLAHKRAKCPDAPMDCAHCGKQSILGRDMDAHLSECTGTMRVGEVMKMIRELKVQMQEMRNRVGSIEAASSASYSSLGSRPVERCASH